MTQFRASSPRGLGELLARELTAFAATEVREQSTSVSFCGTLETAYRACLWSRTANRVFLELAQFQAPDADAFYSAAREIDWSIHIGSGATLACDFTGQHPTLTHTHFAALKLKDAICDELRARAGYRPDIATERPSVRVHAHAHGTAITLALDLAGESLHRRGYRGEAGEAPLKENLAAGILLRSGWAELAASGAEFLDPMCGSGTIVIEAAMIARRIAPGLGRHFAFEQWPGHEAGLWRTLQGEAASAVLPRAQVPILASDRDAGAVEATLANAERAGVTDDLSVSRQSLSDMLPPPGPGLVIVNPPYGIRVGDKKPLRNLFAQLGNVTRARAAGWRLAMLSADRGLERQVQLPFEEEWKSTNGGIPVRLIVAEVPARAE